MQNQMIRAPQPSARKGSVLQALNQRKFLPVTAALLVATLAVASAAPVAQGKLDIQGHRGARGLAPENTLTAFRLALKLGVTTLELDTCVTKDEQVVVSHDCVLNPDITRGPDSEFISGKAVPINSLSYAELTRYDVGRIKPGTAYARRFAEQQGTDGERIPKLADVLKLAREHLPYEVRLNIESKINPGEAALAPTPEVFAKLLLKEIDAAGLRSRSSIQSFDWRVLQAVRPLAPDLELVYLSAQLPNFDTIGAQSPHASPWTAGFVGADYKSVGEMVRAAAGEHKRVVWSPFYRNLTAESLRVARALGLKVVPWTVNEVADMQIQLDLGVDGIITDYPDRLIKLLR